MKFAKVVSLIWCFSPFYLLAAQVDTLDVPSVGMKQTLRAAVVLPSTYQKGKSLYPVLYLLHGGGGSFQDWLTKVPDKTLLHRLADQYNLIIVTPGVAPISYYFDSPVDKTSQYETYIATELRQKIESTYRTIQDRKGRIIAGLSMGGHGALFIATRHSDLYCAAGSMSGVLNINTATWKVEPDFAKSRSENFVHLLGPPKDVQTPYPGYTLVTMADQVKAANLALVFEVGVDDFLIAGNRDMHQQLVASKTPHDYTERPGAHTWEYWGNALPYQMLFFQNVLLGNGSLPIK